MVSSPCWRLARGRLVGARIAMPPVFFGAGYSGRLHLDPHPR
jgi:hypothetical protein